MAGNLQPLDQKFPVVNADGTPTDYFTRWAQQRQIDIGKAITEQALIDYLLAHELQAGNGIGLTPSGNLSDSPTIAAKVQEILDQISTTEGSILYRGAAGWSALAPGTAGKFLQTNGTGADPAWAPAAGTLFKRFGCPSFWYHGSVTFTFNNFGALIFNCPATFTCDGIYAQFQGANATAQITPAIYAYGISPELGAQLITGPTVTGVTAGENFFAFSAPISLTAGLSYLVGIRLAVSSCGMYQSFGTTDLAWAATTGLPLAGAAPSGAGQNSWSNFQLRAV